METDWSPLQSSRHLHSLSFSITPKQLRVQQGRAPRPNNWILHSLPWKTPNTILLSSTLPKDDKGYLYLVLHTAKLSVPSRGIDRNLCTPGMGTAFAQWHHSSERPCGFMYPLSYICPLMKNCESVNVPQGTVITDTEENQNDLWIHSYTVVKICRKIKIVRISRTMLYFLKRQADISLKPNYLLVYLCSLLCMSYCLSWDLSWINIPHFQAKEHKPRGKELTELRAVSPAGGVAVLTFPPVRHCPVTWWQVTCFDAQQDKEEEQNKSTNHWPSSMWHNGSQFIKLKHHVKNRPETFYWVVSIYFKFWNNVGLSSLFSSKLSHLA